MSDLPFVPTVPAAQMQGEVLSCSGLSKTYQSGPQPVNVLRAVTFSVAAGESVAIVGASGSGKSTLLHLLGGLDHASAGSIAWRGRDLSSIPLRERDALRNRQLGFVYQFHHLIGELSALENAALPLRVRRQSIPAAQKKAQALLEHLGLGNRLHHLPSELSGGERQRVAIARALVGEPGCILADEPTGNLDRENAERVFEALTDTCRAQNTALVLVTHAPELAARCQRVMRLTDGVLST